MFERIHRSARDLFVHASLLLIILSLLLSGLLPTNSALAAPLTLAATSIRLDVPSQVMIGEDFSFTVFFSNTGDAPGYGPFVDVVFPTNGIDGLGGTDTPDGLVYDAVLGGTYSDSVLSSIV